MKVSKKLLSLLLVVMLLVTAIPFQAFALEASDTAPVGIYLIVDGNEDNVQEIELSSVAKTKAEASAFTNDEIKAKLPTQYTDPTQYTIDSIDRNAAANYEGTKWMVTVEVSTYVAPTPKDYTVIVKCGDTSCEKTVQNCPTAVSMTEAEAAGKSGAADALALATSAGANDATKALLTADNFKSMFISGTNITIYVKDCGDAENPDAPGTTKVTISIVDSLNGNRTQQGVVGDLYSSVVGTSAHPGYEFRGWMSTNLGRIVDLTKDYITAADTLTAVWSAPTNYTVTYKLNYDDAPLVTRGFTVNQGDHIYNKLYEYVPTRQGYVFRGWSILGRIIKENNDEFTYQSDVDAIAIWDKASNLDPDTALPNEKDGKVWLCIYVNGDTKNEKLRINMTSYCQDGYLTRAEAEKVVKTKITPKAGYKLGYEGLFNEETWHWYKNDPETDGASSIPADLYDDQYIFVMVNNVKVVASDPSNPKTGDYMLTTALTVMGLSGIAAAAVYVTGKKKKG